MVGEAETEERFVVLVVQPIGLGYSLSVCFLERGPVFRLNRFQNRTERLTDENLDVVSVLRSRHRGRLQDLLGLFHHVARELPVPGLRGVAAGPVPPAPLVHTASHPAR